MCLAKPIKDTRNELPSSLISKSVAGHHSPCSRAQTSPRSDDVILDPFQMKEPLRDLIKDTGGPSLARWWTEEEQ